MEVIYLDVLIVINIYIGYFLLSSTKRLMNLSIHRWRMIVASLLSGCVSTVILLDLSVFELVLAQSAIVMLLCFTAFYRRNTHYFFKVVMVFIVVSFVFGGLMFALYYFLMPDSMTLKNGVCYFDINILMLVTLTILSYIVVSITQYVLHKRCNPEQLAVVKIGIQNKNITTKALFDSGNKLVDVFTGLPIMVCELKILEKIMPTQLYFYLLTRGETTLEDLTTLVRVVPIKVVTGETSLMAFKPQEISVDGRACNMLVAVTQQKLSDGTFFAIIGC